VKDPVWVTNVVTCMWTGRLSHACVAGYRLLSLISKNTIVSIPSLGKSCRKIQWHMTLNLVITTASSTFLRIRFRYKKYYGSKIFNYCVGCATQCLHCDEICADCCLLQHIHSKASELRHIAKYTLLTWQYTLLLACLLHTFGDITSNIPLPATILSVLLRS